jgi:flagellar biosynthesis GTPase FlhF
MELLNKIQKELKVPKGQYNSFAKYHYRNCEDILEAVKPHLGDATLILEDEVVCIGDRYYVKATAELSAPWPAMLEGEDSKQKYYVKATATGYAREALDKKGMDEAQITGAASSYARKYALCGLFCIDDGKDADADDNTQAAKEAPAAKPVPPKQVEDKRAAMSKLDAEKLEVQKLAQEKSGQPFFSNRAELDKYIKGATGLIYGEANNAEIIERLKAI